MVMPWLEVYLTGLVTLFAMMNPPAAVPLFLTLTSGMTDREQAAIARRAAINSGVVLLICLAVGALVLEFFSISLAALRVAGGMIIAFLGFRLLFAHEDAHDPDSAAKTSSRGDPSLVPLAIPTLSGPGSMSVVITGFTQIAAATTIVDRVGGYVSAVLVIVTVALSAFLILRASRRVLRLLGDDGIASLKGIMGFLLVCIGVQFVANGIAEFVAKGTGP
ncbi:MAG: MarC family NAAT transporter [Gammaproteobacteria bacterium]|nr:MarC family NAAT transporter [Gammaproteobacteria bacterium]MDH5276444.1 MarC family NAAT transporter [Gammaproteobacteria bacterium]